jgi:acyl-coenzyme A synthetase/AMP-(fatty) acid ligase
MRRFSGLQMFLHALLTDSTLVLKPYDVSVAEFLPVLAATGSNYISGTPTHWRKVLMFEGRKQLNLKQVTLVGEIADQAILDALKRAFPMARLTHIYGSTESGTGFSVHDGKAGFPSDFLDRDLKGLTLKVDNGMLKVKSTRAAIDYVGHTSTPLRDQDGFIDTGDQVELVGDRYRFLGRRNGAVNIGGSRVHPEEVEAAINAHPLVSMSAVSAKKSPFTGAILVADVVLQSGASKIPTDLSDLSTAMIADLKTKLEPYKVPAIIRFVDDLNLSAAGKLDRKSA